ncbi:MAG TPA: hypothetical protein VMP12_03800, partial [Candidatus Sulfotelmatobacter sp.]|nr:hypothetical protein [Candidatus Sulfotelmatobacter sp.]
MQRDSQLAREGRHAENEIRMTVSQATRLLTGDRMKNVELSRQQHLDLYYHMRLNRAVEDTMVKLFRQ